MIFALVLLPDKYITSVLDPDPSVKPIRNRSKTLECQIDERGSPENSTILWLRGTTRLQDSTKYSGLGSDSLTINNLENGDDQSEYNCRVDNQAGAGKQGDPYTLVLLCKYMYTDSGSGLTGVGVGLTKSLIALSLSGT